MALRTIKPSLATLDTRRVKPPPKTADPRTTYTIAAKPAEQLGVPA